MCGILAILEIKGNPDALRGAFESAVKRQLMCDVPYGVLLSGGLDSSLVSAIASRFREKRVEDHDATPAWWPRREKRA